MRHTTDNEMLTALVIEAINHYAPDYFALKRLCSPRGSSQMLFFQHAPLASKNGKRTGTIADFFTSPPDSAQHVTSTKDGTEALLFPKQNFALVKSSQTYKVFPTEPVISPLCNYNRHYPTLSKNEYLYALKRLHRYNNYPTGNYIMEVAQLCRKRWSPKQINHLLKFHPHLIFDNIYQEGQLLERIYQFVSLEYNELLKQQKLISRSHGIINLKQLISYCNKFKQSFCEHKNSLIDLVMESTEAIHAHQRTHEAIQLENIALDILDDGTTALFLKNMCFSQSHSTPSLHQLVRHRSLDSNNLIQPTSNHLKHDCENLAIVLYQILYCTTQPSLLDSFVKAVPDTHRETFELIQSITHPPYNLTTSKKRFLSKQKVIQDLRNLLNRNEQKKDSPDYTSSDESIRAAINTVRYSPNSQEAYNAIEHELSKNIVSLQFTEQCGLTSRSPSPFLDFIQNKKPLSPKVSKKIIMAVSPTQTNKKRPQKRP